jgi:hypothetical protein
MPLGALHDTFSSHDELMGAVIDAVLDGERATAEEHSLSAETVEDGRHLDDLARRRRLGGGPLDRAFRGRGVRGARRRRERTAMTASSWPPRPGFGIVRS